MDDKIIFFLIFGGIIVVFNIIGIVSMFRGDYYHQDEQELKKRPYSRRSQQIEKQRRSGNYNIYVPKDEREDYMRRYGNLTNNEDKKGGEE